MTNLHENTEWSESVIASFRNVAGAMVELHTARFMTRFTYSGPPYVADSPYEVGGWNWRCLGCSRFGREGDPYNDPGFRRLDEARAEAQGHSAVCRAVPHPAEVASWEYLVVSFYAKWLTVEGILDKHGPDGWELVTVNWGKSEAVFKRPGGAS